ncbi:MAG: 30S ribosomal protein S4 [bacterium]
MERQKPKTFMRKSKNMRFSGYKLQLKEKQKARIIYGISESQFKNYFKFAERKKGITIDNLVLCLERRLDNIVFRLGFVGSRTAGKQLISHNHIMVNKRKVNISSYLVKAGDVIEVKEKSKNIVRIHTQSKIEKEIVAWLQISADKLSGSVLKIPSKEEIVLDYNPQLIVEFYSK